MVRCTIMNEDLLGEYGVLEIIVETKEKIVGI